MQVVTSEAQLHRAVVDLLHRAARGDVIWYHVPNGEHRNAVTGARLKSLGVRAGVADLAFVLPPGRAAFLELKRRKGRLSPEQRGFAAACDRAGALHAVVNDIDAAIAQLSDWGVLKITSSAAAACGAWKHRTGRRAAMPSALAGH